MGLMGAAIGVGCVAVNWWQYEEIKSLGRGAFAVVMLVRRKTDKEKFVIKRFHTPMSELNQKVRHEMHDCREPRVAGCGCVKGRVGSRPAWRTGMG